MNLHVVTGLLYGDEGKGSVVSKLAFQLHKEGRVLVVRTGGGQNCGHYTQYLPDFAHLHCQIPSGMFVDESILGLINSNTFCPVEFINEVKSLPNDYLRASLRDRLVINPLTEVTTPYDVIFNKWDMETNMLSTTGTGYGATLQRASNFGMSLKVVDFLDRDFLFAKLNDIRDYYLAEMTSYVSTVLYNEILDVDIEEFMNICTTVLRTLKFADICTVYAHNFPNIIFEGNQGILLDEIHGLAPYTSWGRTVQQNANDLIKKLYISKNCTLNYYDIIRSYKTSHNKSPLCKEDISLREHLLTKSNFAVNEQNYDNPAQKKFKVSFHSFQELLRAAAISKVYRNSFYDNDKINVTNNLIITCEDQVNLNKLLKANLVEMYKFYEFIRYTNTPYANGKFHNLIGYKETLKKVL